MFLTVSTIENLNLFSCCFAVNSVNQATQTCAAEPPVEGRNTPEEVELFAGQLCLFSLLQAATDILSVMVQTWY